MENSCTDLVATCYKGWPRPEPMAIWLIGNALVSINVVTLCCVDSTAYCTEARQRMPVNSSTSHSRRSGTDHTVLPAHYTVPASTSCYLCQVWITQCYLQITPYLPLPRVTCVRYGSHSVTCTLHRTCLYLVLPVSGTDHTVLPANYTHNSVKQIAISWTKITQLYLNGIQ